MTKPKKQKRDELFMMRFTKSERDYLRGLALKFGVSEAHVMREALKTFAPVTTLMEVKS